MLVKTYFGDSLEDTAAAASAELGPGAELLYSRRPGPAASALGRVEAVFAARTGGEAPAPAGFPLAARPAPASVPLRAEVESMIRDLGSEPRGGRFVCPRTDASIRGAAIVAGPPGSGKSASAAKIASRLAALGGPAPVLAELPPASGQPGPAKSYADRLGCRYESLADPGAISWLTAGGAPVIVDTPGAAWGDAAGMERLERLRAFCPEADVHLTLSAELSPADVSAAVRRFEPIRPTRLLFTRLDETSAYGSLWPEAVRRNLPVSYLAFGPGVPGDIEPATAVRLASLAAKPGREWLLARARKTRVAAA